MTELKHIHQFLHKVRNRYFVRNLLKGFMFWTIFLMVTLLFLILADLALNFSSQFITYLRIGYYLILGGLFVFYILQPLIFWLIYPGQYNKLWFAKIIGEQD
jgi:hypothetical protein